MDIKAFSKASGNLIKNGDGNLTFLPDRLPPTIDNDDELTYMVAEVQRKMGELSGIGQLLPNPNILINPYMKNEAVLSSRIEGTQASLADLFLYDIVGKDTDDSFKRIREVRNYVHALHRSLSVIDSGEGTIDIMMIKSTHKKLLQNVRGQERNPGTFRTIQNWIGPRNCDIEDAIYVPPPAECIDDLMNNLIQFIQNPPKNMPPLIQCAIIHYQFEAIHPFCDGNGRIGRLLITLVLRQKRMISKPLLYLSAFFERNKTEYYEKLLSVSQKDQWKEWIMFFLQAVDSQSTITIRNIQALMKLKERYENMLRTKNATKNAFLLKDQLFSDPYITITNASEFLKISFVTAKSTITKLVACGILKEITQNKRNRVYVAHEIFNLVSKGELS